ALKGALRSFDGFARNVTALLVGTEFHEASGDNLGQVALLVALGDFNGFVDLSIPQGASDCRSKCPRLLTGGAESHPAVDHHAKRPAGHDEENDNDRARDPSHLLP